MSHAQDRISLYVDIMIVEALAYGDGLSKSAQTGGVMSDLVGKVKQYADNSIDPNDKTNSLLKLLAPGLIFTTLRMIGLPWWFTALLSLAAAVFHIDVFGILKSIYEKVKSAIGLGKPLSSSQVDEMVSSSVQEHAKPATEEEAAEAQKELESKSYVLIREAKHLKLALNEYDQLLKSGQQRRGMNLGSIFSRYSVKKSATSSILSRVLGLIFKVLLASAGFMVAGDMINHLLGRPNALDNTMQKGKPVAQTSAPTTTAPTITAKQTKFPLNPSYHEENFNGTDNNWIENIPNNKESVENMLVNFAKEVYGGLDGQESNIRSTAGFQAITDAIDWYNHTSAGGPIVFIPRMFTSKKKIVDHFIDDVAAKAP
jgi:hypothetical protein